MTENPIADYNWKGFYIKSQYDNPSDEIIAATKEAAMQITAENANITNEGWEQNQRTDYPLYQITDSTHHMVAVKRVPVYAIQ